MENDEYLGTFVLFIPDRFYRKIRIESEIADIEVPANLKAENVVVKGCRNNIILNDNEVGSTTVSATRSLICFNKKDNKETRIGRYFIEATKCEVLGKLRAEEVLITDTKSNIDLEIEAGSDTSFLRTNKEENENFKVTFNGYSEMSLPEYDHKESYVFNKSEKSRYKLNVVDILKLFSGTDDFDMDLLD